MSDQQPEMSGLDLLQGMIQGRFPPPPFAVTIGARVLSVAPGQAVFGWAATEAYLNPFGLVHGGLLTTLLDSAMGCAAHTNGLASDMFATIELKVSFLRPVPFDGREIQAHGRVLQQGRRIVFTEAHAYDPDGVLLGHATSSLAVIAAQRDDAG